MRVDGDHAWVAVRVVLIRVDQTVAVLGAVAGDVGAEVSGGAVGRELLERAGDLELLIGDLQKGRREEKQWLYQRKDQISVTQPPECL